MNNRQRIIDTALCKSVDRPPFLCCFGPWNETVERWRTEGLEEGKDWDGEFGFDPGFTVVGVNYGYLPAFPYQEIEEKESTRIIRDTFGILQEVRKNGSSIPRYIEYPVKDRKDWERLKEERLDPNDPARFPENWKTIAGELNRGDRAVQLGTYPYGLFGTLRDMMGAEGLLVSFYDQPELIRDMMDYLTEFWLAIYEAVCADVKVDAIHMWEDMSGRQGSLISPAMVRRFMLPNYEKIKSFAGCHGIPVFSLDTDGDCSRLVPLYLEVGINMVFPFEVAAGCDVNRYRAEYPNLCIMGGIDKREIAKGRDAIDRELARIAPMFRHRGYIASLDHLPHPEISWQDFRYFVYRLKEMIGVET